MLLQVVRAPPLCTEEMDCNGLTSPSCLLFVGIAWSFHSQGVVVSTEVVQVTIPPLFGGRPLLSSHSNGLRTTKRVIHSR